MQSSAGCLGCLVVFMIIVVSMALFLVGLPVGGIILGVLLIGQRKGFALAFVLSGVLALWPFVLMRIHDGTPDMGDAHLLAALPLIVTSLLFVAAHDRKDPSLSLERVLAVCLLVTYLLIGSIFLVFQSF